MASEADDSYVEMGEQSSVHKGEASLPSPLSSFDAAAIQTRGFFSQYNAFRYMAMPYFREQPSARLHFALMIALTLCNSAVRVVFSYLSRDFWTALSENDPDEFYRVMRNFLIALVVLAPLNVYYRYQRQQLAIDWRRWMTERVLLLYASNSSVYYGLEQKQQPLNTDKESSTANQRQGASNIAETVDNPDQRISEDVRSFTEFSLTLFLTVLMAVIDLCCFSAILFTILPQLFLAIFVFAAVGTLSTILIGRILIQLNFEKLQKEADLRFSLVRLRENAEQIAFLKGQDVEKKQIQHRLASVIENMQTVNRAVRNLDFFTTYYTYLTWVLPILVVAPDYFAGAVELGVVQQAAASFSHVLDDLSILVTQWESLAEFSAGIDRLHSFLRAMQILDPDRGNTDCDNDDKISAANILTVHLQKTASLTTPMMNASPPSLQKADDQCLIDLQRMYSGKAAISIRDLTLSTPTHHQSTALTLFRNLNLQVGWGERLLITGTSGVGKSSLLRAIAGLWKSGSGVIQRPPDEDVYFLPQKPYCCAGSLRDQLLYPRSSGSVVDRRETESEFPDEVLLEFLRTVDLGDLPQRAAAAAGLGDRVIDLLDIALDWSNMLSLGEQQRLAFARILVNRPKVVVLDESTSAMDVESERRMYELLQSFPTNQRLTYVSIGHRPTLVAYHDSRLELRRDGAGRFGQAVTPPI